MKRVFLSLMICFFWSVGAMDPQSQDTCRHVQMRFTIPKCTRDFGNKLFADFCNDIKECRCVCETEEMYKAYKCYTSNLINDLSEHESDREMIEKLKDYPKVVKDIEGLQHIFKKIATEKKDFFLMKDGINPKNFILMRIFLAFFLPSGQQQGNQ